MFLKPNVIKVLIKRNPLIADLTIIVLALIIGMWQISFFHSIMKWDIIDINLPWRYFTSECLRNGILPLWNPFITTGFPQTADPMTWYPVSWILGLLFGNDLVTLQYEYLFHLLLGALGVYNFGRLFDFKRKTRLITSISFMFSGLFISNAQHFGWIISGAWFPFTIYYYVKYCKKPDFLTGLLFVLCFYCMLSGGYPAFFVITAYILFGIFAYYLYKKATNKQPISSYLLSNAWLAALFFLLSAVVIISSFELSHYLTRADKFTVEFVQSYPLPYQGLISFLFPYATTFNVNFYGYDFSMVNCYVGLMIIIFLIYAVVVRNKKALFFLIIGLFLLSAALADVFPVRKWLYYLPFMNTFRFPTVFRFFAYSFFIVAGGIGFNHFMIQPNKEKKILIILIAITVAIVFFIFFNSFFIEKWKFKLLLLLNFGEFNKIATVNERVILQALILLSFLVIMLFSYFWLSKKSFNAVILILAAIDMVLSVQLNINQTVVYNDDPKPTQAALDKLPEGFPKPDLHDKIKNITEYSNPGIPYLWRNMNIFYKRPTYEGYTPYFLTTMSIAEKSGIYLPVLNNPVVFLADSVNNSNVIDSNYFDTLSVEKIDIISFSPNMIEMNIITNKRQLLTYLQNIYPGWKVSLNNKESKIITTNYTFMSTWVNAGETIVKFEYRPKNIIFCYYVSLITFFSIIVAIIGFFIKKRYHPGIRTLHNQPDIDTKLTG